LFNVRAVWISTYHEINSELLIEASTVTSDDNSILIKFIGKAVKKFRTPVSEASHALMMSTLLKPYSSIHELSFGQIPEIVGSAIEKAFSIGWFLGISLIDKGKLYGTMVVAGNKGQILPENDLISLFAQLTSNILRRKQAEENLLQSEDKFRKAFITSPDSININRLHDGMYVSINKSFTKITGYSEDEVIGKTSLELNIWAIPADRDRLVKGLREKGEVENLETTFIKKNGTIVHGIMSATVIDLDGEPHILSITRDISDRKYSEIALRESEARYRELIELAVDGILLGSSDGTIIGANTCMLDLAGRTLNDILGMHVSDLFDSSALNDTPLRFDLLMEGETVMNERLLLRPDNSQVPVEMRTRMMPDGTYQSIYRDISFRRKAEKEIHESEEWFRMLFEQSSDGIFYMSLDGKLKAVNNSFAELHGYSKDEIQKMTISDLDCPETKAHFAERMHRILKGENLKFEVEHFHKDGHRIPIEVSTGVISMGDEIFVMASHRDISERRKAEMAIRESEEKVQSIIRVAPVGIGLTVNRVLMEVNDYLCNLLGYHRSELINKSSEILYPSRAEFEYVGNVKYEQISLKGTGTVETIFKCKDNRLLNVILSSTPLDRDELSKGVTFTVLDITERKKYESALKESEEKFRSIAESLSDVIFITNPEGIVNYISPSCETFGFTPDECVGRFFGDFLVEGEFEKAMPVFFNAITGNKTTARISLLIKKKNGSHFFAEISGSLFKIGDESAGILGIIRDVTQQKNLESATLESEKRYRELFLNNPMPTYIFDTLTLEFVEVNDAFVKNYGYSREEFSAMTLKDIRLPSDHGILIKSLMDLGEGDFHSATVRHIRKDGTVFPVEVTSHSLPEKNGRKTRLGIVVDISERIMAAEQMKIAKEKAEASDKLKTSFLNNISHEVRTPLNGILGFAELISHDDLSENEKHEALSMVHESSGRLLKTITNYMDISLITSGTLSFNRVSLNPAVLLNDIFNKFKSIGSIRKSELILDIPENGKDCLIHSDPEIIGKILSNIIDNAIKFTESGSIRLGYKLSGDYIEFYVKDTGIGISKKSLANIFNRFVKDDGGNDRISEGSGLGLAIAKGMADIAGADIYVDSELNKGSTFFLKLKLADNLIESLPGNPAKTTSFPNEKNTILIAEDDEINFFYMHALLRRETNSKILHAENGRIAVDLFKANNDISLILMDIKMPELDGLEATRQIKLINPNIPVIAITAYAMSGDEERVLAAGCDGYLSKPIKKEVLLNKLAEFVKV
jgi:PAS domain S-box-containing protein